MTHKKIKPIDSVQNPDTIQTMLDAAGIGYLDKYPKKLAGKIQPVIVINQTDIMENTINKIYPVGSIYISTLSTNPAVLLGTGTWAAFAEGRCLVSVPGGGTGEGTAGTALTDQENRAVGLHTHKIQGLRDEDTTITVQANRDRITRDGGEITSTMIVAAGTVAGTNAPYIQVFMWKRTA